MSSGEIKEVKGAGLFSINPDTQKTICIETLRNEAYKGRGSFEKTQIPRGRLLKNENSLCAAIREFIEETRLAPALARECSISKIPFNLEWRDGNVKYSYTIWICLFSEDTFVPTQSSTTVKVASHDDDTIITLQHTPKTSREHLYDQQYKTCLMKLSSFINRKQKDERIKNIYQNYNNFFAHVENQLTNINANFRKINFIQL